MARYFARNQRNKNLGRERYPRNFSAMISTSGISSALRALTVGWLVAAHCAACAMLSGELQVPSVRLIGVEPQSYSLQVVQLVCRLQVENPNDIALPLQGATLTLQLGQTQTAYGNLVDKVTIPAFAVQNVDVLVNIDLLAALSVISRSGYGNNSELPYEVDGYVDVGIARLGRIPFHETGSLSLKAAGLEIRTSNQ
jgi:LEA14-like dessication related protein